MEIVGYGDRLSVVPGETIRFMVSCRQPSYRADLVQLIHGDTNPQGPGFKERPIPSALDGDYAGREQKIAAGSFAIVPDNAALHLSHGLTLQAWIYPTTPIKGEQGLITKWSAPDGAGFGLVVDDTGGLALVLADGKGSTAHIRSGAPLRQGAWYFVAAIYDATNSRVVLYQEPVKHWPLDPSFATVERTAPADALGQTDAPLVIGAAFEGPAAGKTETGRHFNGKIDRPRVFAGALSADDIASLRAGADPHELGDSLVAAWDFAADIASSKVTDLSPNALHGRTVNMPARGMTGYNWNGDQANYALAPAEYGAIHFHDDDLDDARWDVDFSLTVPADLPSGVYAARFKTDSAEDYVPFYVHPPRGTATAPILFLASTNTYLAYANFNVPEMSYSLFPLQDMNAHVVEHRYMTENSLQSLYDKHSDGSGVCYSSRLRPILNMRPKYRWRQLDCPHAFPADLHLVDWLETKGHAADFITDEDLHVDGIARLSPYRVVLTCSHPEYWSGPMLEAMAAYLEDGGRLMYLGGNGFYWVTSFCPERPHVVEIRRWGGTESWSAEPGEYYHSTTGEQGGLWRNRGRPPQQMVGVGFTSQGFDRSSPYARTPDSVDSRAAFIFDGIGDDDLIGDFPALTLLHGAAGFEVDRADPALGTPPHALTLASSFGHSDSYQHVIEEVHMSDSTQGGSTNPNVRADLVYFEYPHDGAVFSVGSIAWCGALSANAYDNTVSRITDNVLRQFSAG